MRAPTDREFPSQLLAAIKKRREGSVQEALAWLFGRFRGKVKPDLLSMSLLELMGRMSEGLIPLLPVALLKTIIRDRRADGRRRSKLDAKARAILLDKFRGYGGPEPLDELIRAEIQRNVREAVFWGLSGPSAAVTDWRLAGAEDVQIAEALSIARNEHWSPPRVRKAALAARVQLRGLLRDF